ncbi:MAG: hypothetical protein ACREMO_05430 [Gemmatimonadales bacterium]
MSELSPGSVQPSKPQSQEYESPRITVMDEKEVLQVFQITSAGSTWWVM